MKQALNELNRLLPGEQVQVINSLPIPLELEPIINRLMQIKGMGRMSAIEVLFKIGVKLIDEQ